MPQIRQEPPPYNSATASGSPRVLRATAPVPPDARSAESCRAPRLRRTVQGPGLPRAARGGADRHRAERHRQDDDAAHAGGALGTRSRRDPLERGAHRAVLAEASRGRRLRRAPARAQGRALRRGEPGVAGHALGRTRAAHRDRARPRQRLADPPARAASARAVRGPAAAHRARPAPAVAPTAVDPGRAGDRTRRRRRPA